MPALFCGGAYEIRWAGPHPELTQRFSMEMPTAARKGTPASAVRSAVLTMRRCGAATSKRRSLAPVVAIFQPSVGNLLAVFAHPRFPLPRCHVERKARITGAALVELGLYRGTEAGWTDVLTDEVQFVVAKAAPMSGGRA